CTAARPVVVARFVALPAALADARLSARARLGDLHVGVGLDRLADGVPEISPPIERPRNRRPPPPRFRPPNTQPNPPPPPRPPARPGPAPTDRRCRRPPRWRRRRSSARDR